MGVWGDPRAEASFSEHVSGAHHLAIGQTVTLVTWVASGGPVGRACRSAHARLSARRPVSPPAPYASVDCADLRRTLA